MSGTIFNIPEAQGADQVEFETTAADAQIEAHAQHVKDAAHNAASTARCQHDVEAAKNTGVGYVEQAKALATSAISTAQNYLPTAVGGNPSPNTTTNGSVTSNLSSTASTVASTVQAGATAAYGTTKEYLSTAQQIAQPHIENAKGVAQGYLGTAGTQGMNGTGTTPASSTGIPATSAPLESGPHSVNTPYPPTTTTTTGTKIAQNEGAPTTV
ncbi:hypothetical protein BD779DRAFT_1486553 [Infundibulicybe gibba]|nr:hypothetical protein BD779DRAFT_1486553 [Infundibulicybe gibba]